jgi:hypothetical protein
MTRIGSLTRIGALTRVGAVTSDLLLPLNSDFENHLGFQGSGAYARARQFPNFDRRSFNCALNH